VIRFIGYPTGIKQMWEGSLVLTLQNSVTIIVHAEPKVNSTDKTFCTDKTYNREDPMCSNNGKTERVTGKRNENDSAHLPRREGGATAESSATRLQKHFQTDSSISNRGDRCESRQLASSTPGKILTRLENLETRFFSYVKGHQDRLDLRRKESEIAEQEFAAEAALLKEDILHLIRDQQEAENP